MNPKTLPLTIYLRRLVWVCLTPSAIVITLLALALAERLHSERTDQLTAYAKSLAANLDAEILARIYGLQALGSGAPKLNGPDSYALWHKRLTAYDATFDAPVLIADAQRRTLIHSREPLGNSLPVVAKPKGRSALSEASSTGQPAVGDVVTGAVLKQLLVAVAVPISSGGPELFAMSLIPVTQLTEALQAKPPPLGWKVRLVDSVGTVIAPYGEPPIPEPSLLERPRHIQVALAESPWTLQVSVEFSEFYKYRLLLLLLILLGAAATVAGATRAVRSLTVSLSTSIKRMAQALQKDAPQEMSPVGFEATLIAEVENARQEMQRLELAKIDAQENERRRIARELHDGLQQDLAALRLHLSLISGPKEVTPQALRELCVKASALAHGSIQELDRIVKDLRPWLLEQLGLPEALGQLVDGYRQTSDLQIELEVIGNEAAYADLRISISSCLFRVTQECLTNAVKHAQAEFVHIVLDYSDTTMIILQVSDDGVGITSHDHHKPQTLGLRGMAERVEAHGGSLEISRGHQDDSQSGTTIKAVIPT